MAMVFSYIITQQPLPERSLKTTSGSDLTPFFATAFIIAFIKRTDKENLHCSIHSLVLILEISATKE